MPHPKKAMLPCTDQNSVDTLQVEEIRPEPEQNSQKDGTSESGRALQEIVTYLRQMEETEVIAAQWYHVCAVLERITLILYVATYSFLLTRIYPGGSN